MQRFFEKVYLVSTLKRYCDLLFRETIHFNLKLTDKIPVSEILESFCCNDTLHYSLLQFMLTDFNWNIQYFKTRHNAQWCDINPGDLMAFSFAYKSDHFTTTQSFTVLELILACQCTCTRFDEFVRMSNGEWEWISQWKAIPPNWGVIRRLQVHIERKIKKELMINAEQSERIALLGQTYIPVAHLWSSFICPYLLHLSL